MYVAAATATHNGVRTHLLAAPLLRPHQCEQVHLIQWNPIDSGTVAAAIAAPCERTLTHQSGVLDLSCRHQINLFCFGLCDIIIDSFKSSIAYDLHLTCKHLLVHSKL